jgi:VanZ family protein
MFKKNVFSILVALVIMYLSLANAHTFDSVSVFDSVPYFDKFVHIGMYFGLMSAIILEHRNTIQIRGRLFIIGLIPLSYGILMEILQATLTSTRTGDVYDAVADAIGVLLSIMLWKWYNPVGKIKSDNH